MPAIIRIDTRHLERQISRLAASDKQRRYATARALTAVARDAETELRDEIAARFDRPTPWIQKGTFVKAATKADLTAVVGIKDTGQRATPAHYLREHLEGGQRRAKPYERAMQAAGILPAGWLTVPVPGGVKLDQYGNIPRSVIKRILAGVATGRAVRSGSITSRLFVARPDAPRTRHLDPGIWSDVATPAGRQIRPVLLFVRAAGYQERLDLRSSVLSVVQRRFPARFAAALQQAIETAR